MRQAIERAGSRPSRPPFHTEGGGTIEAVEAVRGSFFRSSITQDRPHIWYVVSADSRAVFVRAGALFRNRSPVGAGRMRGTRRFASEARRAPFGTKAGRGPSGVEVCNDPTIEPDRRRPRLPPGAGSPLSARTGNRYVRATSHTSYPCFRCADIRGFSPTMHRCRCPSAGEKCGPRAGRR